MPNLIEIGGGSRKFSKKLVDLTRNDPNTATGWVKNVGQLLAVAGCTGCIARSLRFQHIVVDLQISDINQ